jgi:hypothetical protein
MRHRHAQIADGEPPLHAHAGARRSREYAHVTLLELNTQTQPHTTAQNTPTSSARGARTAKHAHTPTATTHKPVHDARREGRRAGRQALGVAGLEAEDELLRGGAAQRAGGRAAREGSEEEEPHVDLCRLCGQLGVEPNPIIT